MQYAMDNLLKKKNRRQAVFFLDER